MSCSCWNGQIGRKQGGQWSEVTKGAAQTSTNIDSSALMSACAGVLGRPKFTQRGLEENLTYGHLPLIIFVCLFYYFLFHRTLSKFRYTPWRRSNLRNGWNMCSKIHTNEIGMLQSVVLLQCHSVNNLPEPCLWCVEHYLMRVYVTEPADVCLS